MKIGMPEEVCEIIQRLEENGYEAYAVGGCVRDSLLHRIPEDWDITTSATPQEVKQLFERTVDTGIAHGTVTVLIGRQGYEVTTYRVDGEYEDARHPKEVTFTPLLEEDLKRRDFTINAMAYNHRKGLVDIFGGRADLREGVIRCVGDAKERFGEDALRMMRAVRFAAQLGFEIEDQTYQAIRELSGNLSKISAERIATELIKLITSPHPQELREAYETGLTAVFLPEFDRMMETPQNTPHHRYSVGEHTLHAMMEIEPDKILRLTMLFHDMGKPEMRTTDEEGIDHFRGHPQASEQICKKIMRRLKLDNDTIRRVSRLVRWHDLNPIPEEKYIRRALVRVGLEQYPDMFSVKRADISAQSDYHREEKYELLEQYEHRYYQVLDQNDCLSLKQLDIDGSDLIALGVAKGPRIGEILNELLRLVVDEPAKNKKEYLISHVQKNLL
jgi:tRNA nucleotidyltransferase (CCA-adding enzyme)